MKPKRNKESSADSRTPATKFPHPPFPNFCYFFEFVKTSIRGDGHSLVEISTDTAAYISSRIMGPAGRSVRVAPRAYQLLLWIGGSRLRGGCWNWNFPFCFPSLVVWRLPEKKSKVALGRRRFRSVDAHATAIYDQRPSRLVPLVVVASHFTKRKMNYRERRSPYGGRILPLIAV